MASVRFLGKNIQRALRLDTNIVADLGGSSDGRVFPFYAHPYHEETGTPIVDANIKRFIAFDDQMGEWPETIPSCEGILEVYAWIQKGEPQSYDLTYKLRDDIISCLHVLSNISDVINDDDPSDKIRVVRCRCAGARISFNKTTQYWECAVRFDIVMSRGESYDTADAGDAEW